MTFLNFGSVSAPKHFSPFRHSSYQDRKKLMTLTCPKTNIMVKKFKPPLLIMTRMHSTNIRKFWFDDLWWHHAVFCSLSLSLTQVQYTQLWQGFQHLTNEKLTVFRMTLKKDHISDHDSANYLYKRKFHLLGRI